MPSSDSKAPFGFSFSVCLIMLTLGLFAVGYCIWLSIGDGMPLGLSIPVSGMLLCVAILIFNLARELWRKS